MDDRSIPIVEGEALLYLSDGQNGRLPVGTPAWYAWLDTATRFAFRSPFGTFTARKERAGNRRGGWYWRAYRKRGGKLYRAYLGHSATLTNTRLQAIAARLAAQETAARDELDTHEASPLAPVPPQSSPEQQWPCLLPVQLTSFVGREQEIAAICNLLLRDEVRLLTLTGPGGVGKTRVALAVAERVRQEFRAGVYFVSLASITEAELVLPTIAGTLGVKATPVQSQQERLLSFLRDRRLLLLLDNFEQVLSSASHLLALLLACPLVKLLVTSRAVLHLRGEQVFPVPPLALPNPNSLSAETLLSSSSAVTLFCQRAQEVSPDFQLTPENAMAVAEICRRLDGLPLALELAAARIKLFSPRALLMGLQQGQRLISSARDVPARQQTLQQTITWSYDLLNDREQALFRHLSIFVGGCTLEAAATVRQEFDETGEDLLDLVSSLLDKSLLQVSRGQDAPRLQFLETIRAFGLECLVEAGELRAAAQAHASYFLRVAETTAPELYGPSQAAWLATLAREHDNFRAALRWLLESRASEQVLRLCVALARFWTIRGYVVEGREWLHMALEVASQDPQATTVRARALSWAGWLALLQGDLATAATLCQAGLDLSQQLLDRQGMALALHRLGIIFSARGDDAKACSLLEESIKHYQVLDDRSGLAYSLMALGGRFIRQKPPEEIRALLNESLALFQVLKNNEGIAWSLFGMARLSLRLSEFERASLIGREALILFRKVGLDEGVAQALLLLGQAQLYQGEAASAESLLQKSLQLFQEVGSRQSVANALFSLACVAVLQGSREAARRYWVESLALLRALQDAPGMIAALEGMAATASRQQEARWAAHLLGAAEALRDSARLSLSSAERAAYERTITMTRIQLDPATFAAARAFGRTLSPEQAFAWRDTSQARQSPGTPDNLSPREMEVLHLLAQGLTNAQIATQLVISPRTVNAHLRSIYNKLSVTSRTAAVRYAIARQLI